MFIHVFDEIGANAVDADVSGLCMSPGKIVSFKRTCLEVYTLLVIGSR